MSLQGALQLAGKLTIRMAAAGERAFDAVCVRFQKVFYFDLISAQSQDSGEVLRLKATLRKTQAQLDATQRTVESQEGERFFITRGYVFASKSSIVCVCVCRANPHPRDDREGPR